MSDKRLRALDALFAERVMGCKVGTSGDDPSCECNYERPHGEYDNCCGDHRRRLAPYTTSLDAAWPGVDAVDSSMGYEFFTLERDDVTVGWSAYFPPIIGDGKTYSESEAEHPAEALVLACLRAVGVAEKEIEAAGK